MTEVTYVLVDAAATEYRDITRVEAEEYGGDGTVLALHTMANGALSIECETYYGKDMVFNMEISQPRPRALRTFLAALYADANEEAAR